MSSPHRFVVRRQEWTPPDVTGIRRLLPEKWTRVAECRTADDAYTKYAELLADARRTLNPFHLGGPTLFYQTSLPPHALHDFLLDRDLTPPANSLSSSPNYAFWWVKSNRTFTDSQRAHVWAACDKLTLFDVLEEDDRTAAHLVVEAVWQNVNEEYAQAVDEGGHPVAAFQRLRDARGECRRRNEGYRSGVEGPPFEWFTVGVKPTTGAGGGSHLSRDEVDFFASHPVPFRGGNAGDRCHIIVRQGYSERGGYICDTEEEFSQFNLGARVPLVAFTSRASADEFLRGLSRRARSGMNPFALVWPTYFTGVCSLVEDREAYRQGLPNGLALDDAIDVVRNLETTPLPPAYDEWEPEWTAAWVAWYDRVVQWSPEYVDVIWGTFADFRLFEVIEVPLGP